MQEPNGHRRRGARLPRASRPRRKWRWAVLGLLFPLLFFLVIAVGVAAMAFRHMEIFRPTERGALPVVPTAHAILRDALCRVSLA